MSFYALCKKHTADTWKWIGEKRTYPFKPQETAVFQFTALISVSAAAQSNKRNIHPYSLVRLFQCKKQQTLHAEMRSANVLPVNLQTDVTFFHLDGMLGKKEADATMETGKATFSSTENQENE